MSFVFTGTQIVYSNLGGAGPLLPGGVLAGEQGIRYVNVGVSYTLAGVPIYLDLVVTNQTAYTPYNASLNVLNGKFAQINLACNHDVLLRVTIVASCSAGSSCELCDDPSLDEAQRVSCYAAGCACFGTNASAPGECSGASREAAHNGYPPSVTAARRRSVTREST